MANMLNVSVLSFFIYLLSLLPFRVLYVLSDLGYVLLYHIIGYRKAVVFNNLKNAFPEKSKEERRQIARKFYRFLPDLLVEAIKMRSISTRDVETRMLMCQTEYLELHFRSVNAFIRSAVLRLGIVFFISFIFRFSPFLLIIK